MDKKTKETIRKIKWNFIMLNVLMVIFLFFIVGLFIKISISNQERDSQAKIQTDKLTEISNSIIRRLDEISNYSITGVYQNEEIKQKIDNIEFNRNWDLR